MMEALQIALREHREGVAEATNRNDGIPAERYNFGEKKPWCASFVAYCFREAGHPLPGNRWKLPSVAYMEKQLLAAGAEVETPEPGDIITFTNRGASDTGPGRHVGIIEKVQGGTLITIEGNVRHAVHRCTHSRTSARIAKFLRWKRS